MSKWIDIKTEDGIISLPICNIKFIRESSCFEDRCYIHLFESKGPIFALQSREELVNQCKQ